MAIVLLKIAWYDNFFLLYDKQGSLVKSVSTLYRFGHSLLPSTIERWSKTHRYSYDDVMDVLVCVRIHVYF